MLVGLHVVGLLVTGFLSATSSWSESEDAKKRFLWAPLTTASLTVSWPAPATDGGFQ
jgi:hypothetical protein